MGRQYPEYITFVDNENRFTGQETEYTDFYPVRLSNGVIVCFPFKDLPGDGREAITNLNYPQADFSVQDAIAKALAERIQHLRPEIFVSLGQSVPLGEHLSRIFGLPNQVPLTNSGKFWMEDGLSTISSSVTSGEKPVYLDPHLVSRIEGRRAVVADEVTNTGGSLVKMCDLTKRARPVELHIAVALTEGHLWEEKLRENGITPESVIRAGHIPIFRINERGAKVPKISTL